MQLIGIKRADELEPGDQVVFIQDSSTILRKVLKVETENGSGYLLIKTTKPRGLGDLLLMPHEQVLIAGAEA